MNSYSLKHSALIVVDMQRYFLEKNAPAFLNPSKNLLKNVISLIDSFRILKRPIVFTRHAHIKGSDAGQMGNWWKNELPWEGNKYSEIVRDIQPWPGELVITKTAYSAFERTKLDTFLKKKHVDTVVVCGVMTNLCVETTVRHAFMKDYQPVVVGDACAGKNRAHHKASILNLSYGFAFIERVKDICEESRRAR